MFQQPKQQQKFNKTKTGASISRKSTPRQRIELVDNRADSNVQLKRKFSAVKEDVVNHSDTIQCARVGERTLGMKEVPKDYAPTETAYKQLLARHDRGIYHQHIFFDDGNDPGDIGFHDNALFHEPHMEGAYHWSIQGLNDQEMRLAVHNVGDPGTYHVLGNNCQAYVTKVIKQYNNVKGYYQQGPSKEEHQEKSAMGYSLL